MDFGDILNEWESEKREVSKAPSPPPKPAAMPKKTQGKAASSMEAWLSANGVRDKDAEPGEAPDGAARGRESRRLAFLRPMPPAFKSDRPRESDFRKDRGDMHPRFSIQNLRMHLRPHRLRWAVGSIRKIECTADSGLPLRPEHPHIVPGSLLFQEAQIGLDGARVTSGRELSPDLPVP